jgi:hypothetical protein
MNGLGNALGETTAVVIAKRIGAFPHARCR